MARVHGIPALSEGRGWTAAGAFTSRRGTGEGFFVGDTYMDPEAGCTRASDGALARARVVSEKCVEGPKKIRVWSLFLSVR